MARGGMVMLDRRGSQQQSLETVRGSAVRSAVLRCLVAVSHAELFPCPLQFRQCQCHRRLVFENGILSRS